MLRFILPRYAYLYNKLDEMPQELLTWANLIQNVEDKISTNIALGCCALSFGILYLEQLHRVMEVVVSLMVF